MKKFIIVFLLTLCICKTVSGEYGVGDTTTATADYRWIRASLTSAAANTAIDFLTNAEVGSTRTAYLVTYIGYVNGSTAWTAGAGGMTKVDVLDSSGLNSFVAITLANLTGNTAYFPGGTNNAMGSSYLLRTGTPIGNGLRLVADGTATAGSTLHVTALIKLE